MVTVRLENSEGVDERKIFLIRIEYGLNTNLVVQCVSDGLYYIMRNDNENFERYEIDSIIKTLDKVENVIDEAYEELEYEEEF